MARGYLTMFKITGNENYKGKAISCLEWLKNNKAPGIIITAGENCLILQAGEVDRENWNQLPFGLVLSDRPFLMPMRSLEHRIFGDRFKHMQLDY